MVETTIRKAQYSGTANQRVFPITFPFIKDEDIRAIVTGSDGNDTIVTGNFEIDHPTTETSNFIYPVTGAPLPFGSTITIYRATDMRQLTQLLNGGDFNADVIELSLDQLVMMIQEVYEQVGRGPTIPISENVNFDQLVIQLLEATTRAEAARDFVEEVIAPWPSPQDGDEGDVLSIGPEGAAMWETPHLTANRIIYVRTNGNDKNTGFSEATAVKTLVQAQRIANRLDPGNHAVCIDVGPGEFAAVNIVAPKYGIGRLYIQGAGNDLTTLINNHIIYSPVSISNMNVTGRVLLYGELRIAAYSASLTATIKFTGSGTTYILGVQGSGVAYLYSAIIELAGSFTYALYPSFAGKILCNEATVFKLIGTVTFTQFARAARGGQIHFYECTFEGTGTGTKYNIYQGGVISGQGANADLTSLPGNVAGTVSVTLALRPTLSLNNRVSVSISTSAATPTIFAADGFFICSVRGNGGYVLYVSDDGVTWQTMQLTPGDLTSGACAFPVRAGQRVRSNGQHTHYYAFLIPWI